MRLTFRRYWTRRSVRPFHQGTATGLSISAGGEDDREVGAAMEGHANLGLGDGDVGGHVDVARRDASVDKSRVA